ncbi:hypothetical protein BST61_g9697 [Cercospora zeina]
MAATDIITDPVLVSVLDAAKEARKQCNDLLDFIEQNGASAYEEPKLLAEQKVLSSRLAILRGLNRKAIMSVRSTKQETTEARQEIDELHLQLQNLYYEQRHLHGEIRGCEEYNHKYEQLGMIPVEDFLAEHPQYHDSTDHDLTVARIEDEHAARKDLEARRLELEKRKDALMKRNAAEKEQLAALDDTLEKWVVGGQEKVGKLFEGREKKAAEAAAK